MNSSRPLIERAISSANPSSTWQRTPLELGLDGRRRRLDERGRGAPHEEERDALPSWWSIAWSWVIGRKMRAPIPSIEIPTISNDVPRSSIRSPTASRATAASRESTTTSPAARSALPATIRRPPPMDEKLLGIDPVDDVELVLEGRRPRDDG